MIQSPATLRSSALPLGLGHGVSDGAAGWMIGVLANELPPQQLGALVLLYNLLAFGGQLPAGLLVDRVGHARGFALASLLLMSGALLLAGAGGWLAAIVLAGVASAVYHVAGGALALHLSGGRAAAVGLFAAPGVVGLAAGGTLAALGVDARPVLVLLLALVTLLVARGAAGPRPATIVQAHTPQIDGHDLVMIVLLAVIALRSLIWNTLQLVAEGRHETLLALALAAALGKIAGGPLADRFGAQRYLRLSLVFAAPLLALAGTQPWALLLGTALLQSATPAALVLVFHVLPRAPALASGLAFGLAIAVGAVPIFSAEIIPLLRTPPMVVVLALLAGLLAVWGTRRLMRDGVIG